jgi:hypothetical protein
MSIGELIIPKRPFITAHVQKFRETKNIFLLIRALFLVIRQQRTLELLYGFYCDLFYRPSLVCSGDTQATLISILKEESASVHRGTLSRGQLIELYGVAFKVDLLPADFQGTRAESIWHEEGHLIIGEYGENSRVAYMTPESCVISDYYRSIPSVRHIHSIEGYGDSGEFFVSTGDTSKFLDLWMVKNGTISFVRRLSKRLAGFTAAVRVNGEYYFGTDFSSRPNFIETLGGTKYFFPEKAYKLHVTAFRAFFDRYIVAMNSELRIVGGRRTLTVFDTIEQRFIYCEYWAGETKPSGEPGGVKIGEPTIHRADLLAADIQGV